MELRQIIKQVLLENLSYELPEYRRDINMEQELKKLMSPLRVFLRRLSKYDENTVFENRKNIMGTILEYIHIQLDKNDDEFETEEDFQKDDERGTPEFDNEDRLKLLKKLKSLFSKYLKGESNQRRELNKERILMDLYYFIDIYLDFSKDERIQETTIYRDDYGSVQKTSIKSTGMLNEAEYQGRKVQLGKIMQGDIKKFKVYVKNDKGKVVKVNFGFGGKSAKGKRMVIKKNNPARRKSFRARMNCDNPGPRWKPRYWACRTW